MPRVANSTKQKNKKFKGAGKAKKQAFVKDKPKTKGIAKVRNSRKLSKVQRMKEQSAKKVKEAAKITAVNEYLDAQTKGTVEQKLKSQNQVRIVLLIPCNQNADVKSIMEALAFYCSQDDSYRVRKDLNACRGFPAFQIMAGPQRSPIKNKIFIVGSHREPKELIDLAKCADIVCPVVSALSANVQKIVEDPLNYAGTFDQAGYSTINLLRSLGLPKVIGLIQHIDRLQNKHQAKVEKFYSRFLQSEFGDEKIMTLRSNNDLVTLLRVYDSCGLLQQHWRDNRGFILGDRVTANSNTSVTIGGFLKGNCINSNQVAHLTGFDDYLIQKIEIYGLKASASRASKVMQVQNNKEIAQIHQLQQYQTIPEQLNPFSKPQTHDDGDILSAIQGLQLEPHQQPAKQDSDKDMQDEDEDEGEWEDDDAGGNQEKQQQRAKRVEMQMRAQQELQFQDEVEYASEEFLREKFRMYRGLKSFKASKWNELENLPNQYDRIFFFKHYNQTHQAALRDNLARGFAYPGFYVKVTLQGVDAAKVIQYSQKMPLIMSFLLKHERKMTVLHGKIQSNPHYQGDIEAKSNELVMVSFGFKRLLVKPTYSRCINGTQKTKYVKQIGQNSEGYYFCSFYGTNFFPHSPFLVFRVNQFNPQQMQGSPMLRGVLAKCDPHHIILQRIIITGYPYKINRRRSTVRYMFFNPGDVKYFRPIEVHTKMGLRGKIEQSLGTHGLMKVLFNQQIKHNDTVCMYLYKRVFPEASF